MADNYSDLIRSLNLREKITLLNVNSANLTAQDWAWG